MSGEEQKDTYYLDGGSVKDALEWGEQANASPELSNDRTTECPYDKEKYDKLKGIGGKRLTFRIMCDNGAQHDFSGVLSVAMLPIFADEERKMRITIKDMEELT